MEMFCITLIECHEWLIIWFIINLGILLDDNASD